MTKTVPRPAETPRVSSHAYREYATAYQTLSTFLKKSAEDVARIVPVPETSWDGVAADKFTTMMTQVAGATSTASGVAYLISAYYENVADTVAKMEGDLRELSRKHANVKKGPVGPLLGVIANPVALVASLFADSDEERMRDAAQEMRKIHRQWDELDRAASTDIRMRFLPALQEAMNLLPFKVKLPGSPGPAGSKPPTAPPSAATPGSAGGVFPGYAPGGTAPGGTTPGAPGAGTSGAGTSGAGTSGAGTAGEATPAPGTTTPGTPQSPSSPSVLGAGYVVVSGNSWWQISESALRSTGANPSPSQVKRYMEELQVANPPGQASVLYVGRTLMLPEPSKVKGLDLETPPTRP